MKASGIEAVRGVVLEESETILRKAHATYPFLLVTGDLYLTSRRLIWVAHRFNFPWLKPRKVELHLSDIDDCYCDVMLFVYPFMIVRAGGQEHSFRLYRWIGPLIGWLGLTKQWAEAINHARQQVAND